MSDFIDLYCERTGPGFWDEPVNALTNGLFAVCEDFPTGIHFLWHAINAVVLYLAVVAYDSNRRGGALPGAGCWPPDRSRGRGYTGVSRRQCCRPTGIHRRTPSMRIVLLGNAGAGKTTMARRIMGDDPVPRLSLDEIAWNPGPVRKPLEESLALLAGFADAGDRWIIEGCYGDLVAAALPRCDELRFLNPGVEACVAHCRRRPYEPEKFASPAEQDAALAFLVDWVRSYETRDDEYGLACHRRLFDGFGGPKREYVRVDDYEPPT